jgi:hypothetical protein
MHCGGGIPKYDALGMQGIILWIHQMWGFTRNVAYKSNTCGSQTVALLRAPRLSVGNVPNRSVSWEVISRVHGKVFCLHSHNMGEVDQRRATAARQTATYTPSTVVWGAALRSCFNTSDGRCLMPDGRGLWGDTPFAAVIAHAAWIAHHAYAPWGVAVRLARTLLEWKPWTFCVEVQSLDSFQMRNKTRESVQPRHVCIARLCINLCFQCGVAPIFGVLRGRVGQ